MSFFTIFTTTPWESQSEKLSEVKLLSTKTIFNAFPVLEKEFLDDLNILIAGKKHYSCFQTIRRVVGPDKEDYDIKNFRFIWVFDEKDRFYQYLIQIADSAQNQSKSILVAVAPPEIGKLLKNYGEDAIKKLFSLITTSTKIRLLIYLSPKGKSIAEELKTYNVSQKDLHNMNYIRSMANRYNLKGQWFPTFESRCPICNNVLTPLQDYRVGFGKLICLKCGYKQ